jgi:hypothetical protein
MNWDPSTVRLLADAEEVDIVVPSPDRPEVRAPIWIVAVDGDLYVRSWKGDAGIWYRRALRYGTGRVVGAGREYPVRFVAAAEPGVNARIDEAYRRKYGSSSYLEAMVRPPAAKTTMRLDPDDAASVNSPAGSS